MPELGDQPTQNTCLVVTRPNQTLPRLATAFRLPRSRERESSRFPTGPQGLFFKNLLDDSSGGEGT